LLLVWTVSRANAPHATRQAPEIVSTAITTVFARANAGQENEHEQHFKRPRVLAEVPGGLKQGEKSDGHRETQAEARWAEQESQYQQHAPEKFRQACEQPPDLRQKVDADACHGMAQLRPGPGSSRHFGPTMEHVHYPKSNATDEEARVCESRKGAKHPGI
jgi:hypothetical protein